jgi:hypothetical protein
MICELSNGACQTIGCIIRVSSSIHGSLPLFLLNGIKIELIMSSALEALHWDPSNQSDWVLVAMDCMMSMMISQALEDRL